jgi:uncharacterized protein YecT (DUF1311 family)
MSVEKAMISLAILAAVSAVNAAQPAAPPCPGETTLEINACLGRQLDAVDADLSRYVAAARKRLVAEAPSALGDFDKAETAWTAYRKAECDAVYDNWSGGTIRDAMDLTCQIQITRLHTQTLWLNWLTYMDSTPPILPEPPLQTAP